MRSLPKPLVEGLQAVDLILHLSDVTEPFVLDLPAEIAPVEAVAGSNDPPELVERLGRRRVVEVGGVRIGLTHGDLGHGRTTPERASSVFAEETVELVACAHSDIPLIERGPTDGCSTPALPPTSGASQPVATRCSRSRTARSSLAWSPSNADFSAAAAGPRMQAAGTRSAAQRR